MNNKIKLYLTKSKYRIYLGNGQYLYLGKISETEARAIFSRVQSDLTLGDFDGSLRRYTPNKVSSLVTGGNKQGSELSGDIFEHYQEWVALKGKPIEPYKGHYQNIYLVLKKLDEFKTIESGLKELSKKWSNGTYRTYRTYLNQFFDYLVKINYWDINPICNLKVNRKDKSDNIKPFNKSEVSQILDKFSELYPYYRDLCEFLFLTGVRPGEALALTWDKVNFAENLITISHAVGRDTTDSPWATRKILKDTKTGVSANIPMSSRLKVLLKNRYTEYLSDSSQNNRKNLIFPGLMGGYLSWDKFRDKWKVVLSELNLTYRNPYQTRHTALSYVASSQGLLAAAKLARHTNSVTVAKHYARYVNDVVLPDYSINTS